MSASDHLNENQHSYSPIHICNGCAYNNHVNATGESVGTEQMVTATPYKEQEGFTTDTCKQCGKNAVLFKANPTNGVPLLKKDYR